MKKLNSEFSRKKFLTAIGILLFLAFACNDDPKYGAGPDLVGSQEMVKEVFTMVEEQPQFEGGLSAFYKYIRKEIIYPKIARKMGIEGQVLVQFVVDKDGSLSDIETISGISADCDQEVSRVLQNTPSFQPGSQRGKPVRVRMAIPIIFKLSETKNPDNSPQGIIVVEEVQPRNNNLKVDARYVNGRWSGTVYDEEGGALPGANIIVAGTNKGTVSDLDGSFTVMADPSSDLQISFVGYETLTIEEE